MDLVEKVIQILAEGQVSLQKLIATLATENERRFAFVAVRAAETDRRMLKTDERMEKLVIAIGKLIAARRQRLDCV